MSKRNVMTQTTSPLISAEELRSTLASSNVRLFDVRGRWGGDPADALANYNDEHIEGAVFLDWTTHFLEPNVATHLASVSLWEDATLSFQALGISKDDSVVLYDDYHHMLAGRVWWAMKHWGFKNVRVLNGGWANWKKMSFETSSHAHAYAKGNFVATESRLRVSMDALLKTKDTIQLIDARGVKGYQGKPEDERTGHIPGAINIPYSETLDSDSGLFKSKKALTELFDNRLDGFKNASIVSSCGSGYAGTVVLLALQQLGIKAPLFDNSFSIWKLDPKRPVEQVQLQNY